LEEAGTGNVGLYAGGFKPPHKAHFNNAKFLAKKVDSLIIFIGPKVREGIRITAEQSRDIWQIYSKHISTPVKIIISEITPIRDIYTFADENLENYEKIITGALPEEIKKFAYFEKNRDKYSNVEILELPRIGSIASKFSATSIRGSIHFLKKGEWIPTELSEKDKETVINIAMINAPSEKEIQMQEALDNKDIKAGDEIEFWAKEIISDKKIILSQLGPKVDLWDGIDEKYKPMMITEGTVTKITSYGAFVELEKGISGLIHKSKLKAANLTKGDVINIKIGSVNVSDRKITMNVA
jgi:hypothetical protein